MLVVVFLGCFGPACLESLIFLSWQDGVFDLGNEAISSFSLQEVDMSKGLFQARFLVIGNFLLSGFEMLMQDFDGKVIDLLISQVLDLLIHDPHNSLLLDAHDIIDNDLLGGELLLQLFALLRSLALAELALEFFLFFVILFFFSQLHVCLSELEERLL